MEDIPSYQVMEDDYEASSEGELMTPEVEEILTPPATKVDVEIITVESGKKVQIN